MSFVLKLFLLFFLVEKIIVIDNWIFEMIFIEDELIFEVLEVVVREVKPLGGWVMAGGWIKRV